MWQKSAYLEKLLADEIRQNYPALQIEFGKGSSTSAEVSTQTPVGSPDLFLFYGRKAICQIEVTGSDKVTPSTAWFAHHKVTYAKGLEDPDSYGVFLFYGRNHQIRYFATATDIFRHTRGETTKTIRGLQEKYHIIPVVYLKSERGFWEWIQSRIEKVL